MEYSKRIIIGNIKSRLLCSHRLILVLLVMSPLAHGQSLLDAEQQRRRSQQEAEERLRGQQAPGVRLPQAHAETAINPDALDLPEEPPCFALTHLEVDTGGESSFAWAPAWLERYAGRCVGREGIERIVRRLSAKLTAQGDVTTRIGLPEQLLGEGILRLQIIPGRIGAIRFADSTRTSWQSAFPARAGDLLNLRDIEQALEQFKRVPSQDADIQIIPGEKSAESDIVITLKAGKPWRVALTADDAGASASGRRQGSATFALDNPLGLNDLFSAGLNYDLWNNPHTKGTAGHNISYSVPWGNWTYQFTDSAWQYRQTIQGVNQTFLSSGDSYADELRISRLIFRDRSAKTTLFLRVQARSQSSAIEHVEIDVQRQRMTAAELGFAHRQYLGNAQLDLTLAHRQGVPWFGGKKDAPDKANDAPTYRYQLSTLDAALLLPFRLGDLPLRWSSALRLQHSQDALYATDYIAIGGRYTVRGFDGERTLAAAKGGYWRNDLEIPLGESGQIGYLGFDHGGVGGAGAGNLAGKTLTGVALGLRGATVYQGITLSYDLFAGWALSKPDAMTTARPATGCQLFAQY
jgi:hemolysin activation/secretion protein